MVDLTPVNSKPAHLYIKAFPTDVLLLKDSLGMTMAPGKKGNSITALWDRSLYKTDILVSLMENFEFDNLKIPNIREK